MVLRITLYGWVVNNDPVLGPGSGVLVDLVYFISDMATVQDVLTIVNRAGYKMIAKRIGNMKSNPVEADRVTVEDWNEHIKIGTENVGNVNFNEPGSYSRYNLPQGPI
jgi:hypothetical protein